MARKPHIAYYLNMKFELFPLINTLDELEQSCRVAGVSYIYFSEVEANLRPPFRRMLSPDSIHIPWLRVVSRVTDPDAVLYEILH
jgi:hypothetical protein